MQQKKTENDSLKRQQKPLSIFRECRFRKISRDENYSTFF